MVALLPRVDEHENIVRTDAEHDEEPNQHDRVDSALSDDDPDKHGHGHGDDDLEEAGEHEEKGARVRQEEDRDDDRRPLG